MTPEEAAKYRRIRAEIEAEKPQIIVKAQIARREARRRQLATVMQELKAGREAKGLSPADVSCAAAVDGECRSNSAEH